MPSQDELSQDIGGDAASFQRMESASDTAAFPHPEAADGKLRASATSAAPGAIRTLPLRDARQIAEREAIELALRENHGRVPAAAAALRISRAQLYRLIGRLQVPLHPENAPPGESAH